MARRAASESTAELAPQPVNRPIDIDYGDGGDTVSRLDDALFVEEEEQEEHEEEVPEQPEDDDEAEESEADESDAESHADSVEVDGKLIELPEGTPPELAEAISEAISAKEKAMQADYTRKTQEVAEQRKAATALAQQAQQQAAFQQRSIERMVRYNTIAAQLQQYEQIDWNELSDSDPMAYMRARDQRNELRAAAQQMQAEHQAEFQRHQAEEHAQMQQSYQACVDTLTQKIPNYDRAVDEKLVQTAVDLGKRYGIEVDVERLSNTFDPLTWIGLYELSKAAEARSSAKQKIARDKPKPFVKPGAKVSRATETERRQREHLRRTGTGAASLIEKYI